ncbi:MAG: hypothetical protein MUP70_07105 [Candidatus Aminicenantes bacterium]|nr:hypothetical protein [Candidatus Aminicenantes bacterium]
MNNLNSSGLENVCRELSGEFQGVLAWKWDDRFQTVLAEFNVDNKERIHNSLERRLDRIWDSSNIEKAPVVVQTISSTFGGIMPGQLLFTSDPDQDALVFCAWWPWGNGETISIRLSPFYKKPFDSDRAEGPQEFKKWFGVNIDITGAV